MALARKEQELEFFVAQPALLTLHTIHASVMLLICLILFGMFLFLPVWDALIHSSPYLSSWFLFSPLPGTKHEDAASDMQFPTILLGLASCFLGFIAMSRVSVSMRAYDRLEAHTKESLIKKVGDPPVH